MRITLKEALKLISGERGFWYYQVEIARKEIWGGYFYRKCQAAKALQAAVSQLPQ